MVSSWVKSQSPALSSRTRYSASFGRTGFIASYRCWPSAVVRQSTAGPTRFSLRCVQPPAQMERLWPVFCPLAKRGIADSSELLISHLAAAARITQSNHRIRNRAVPDRPAKAHLNSLIARIDRDDYAQAPAHEMEPWMRGFKCEPAVILLRLDCAGNPFSRPFSSHAAPPPGPWLTSSLYTGNIAVDFAVLVNFNDLLGSERHTHFTFSIREVPPLIASPAEAKSFLLLSVVVFPLLIRAM